MSIRRAKSITELYEEVKRYDLVVTVDSPLSRALNRRLDRPHLGRFAATPRMLASGGFAPHDDRRLFLDLVDRTELSWKEADHVLGTILGCWEETGELTAILDYDRFDTPETRTALSVLEDADSAHHDLAAYTPDESQSVVAIGIEQFSELDKQVLPADYDVISPFAEGCFELPPFHSYESATGIVDALLENITPTNADDVAVVVDQASEYPALLTSAFEANGVPYYGGPKFADSEGIRTCLGLLRAAYAGDEIALQRVRPLLSALGIDAPVADDHKRFHTLDYPDLQPVQAFCRSVDDYRFADVVATVEEWGGYSLDAFDAELTRLGLREQPVTEASVDNLVWYLQSFDVPVDREQSGVLLADPTSAAAVDRPLVFYLGMDSGWTHRIPDRPWIDSAAVDRRNLQQFQLLLQNGSQQYYLVQNTAGGEPVTPCLYFHDLLDTEFESFEDLPHVSHTQRGGGGGHGFTKPDDGVNVDADSEPVETISPSSLQTLVNCPRDYLFDRIVESTDRDYFTKGTLYHDFAEFTVNHPEFVADLDREAVVDLMVEEMRPFVADHRLALLRTEFEVATDVIETFLDQSPPTTAQIGDSEYIKGYDSRDASNAFAEVFDRELSSPLTEQWFENPALGAEGVVDLIHAPTRLLDYKSGTANSASKVVSQSATDPVDDEPTFQAIEYLTHHRRHQPDEPLEFVFFHFADLVDDAITGEFDPEDALVRISYHPTTFVEWAGSWDAFDSLCAGVAESNDRRKTLEKLGYDAYKRFFETHSLPDTESTDELLDSAFAAAFEAEAVSTVGEYTYVTSGVESTLKKLLSLRSAQYFSDDVDAFERFLAEWVDRANEYRETGFPVGEPNVDRLRHRDLIRADEGAGQ